jgi:hypothetical protein
MNNPTYYFNAYQGFIRSLENTTASWTTGCILGASNSPGIGIATGVTNLEQSLPSWTLLTQTGAARAPQDGQLIGTVASILVPGITVVDQADSTGTGPYSSTEGLATLSDLADGWTAVPA